MRVLVAAPCLFLAVLAAVAPADGQTDQKSVEGRWALLSIAIPETKINYEEPSYFLNVGGGRMKLVMQKGEPGWDYGYLLRPADRPAALDLDDGTGTPMKASYALEGERLTIAFPVAEKGRPRQLAIGKDCELVLVFRRLSPR